MRIAMIGSRGLRSDYSGIEALLRELCPRLVARGHDVAVFGEPGDGRRYLGVSAVSVPALPGKYFETLSRSFLATCRAAADRFDVIHFHDAGPGLFGRLASLRGVPTVLTLHARDWKHAKWPRPARAALERIEAVAVRSADAVTVVAEPLRDYLLERYALSSALLPNLVEPREHVPPGPVCARLGLRGGDFILFAGRLVRDKAPHELIDAFLRVETDKKLVLAGGDRYEQRYARELATAARDNVLLAGHLPASELAELLANAYLLVHPSHVEGRPMVVLEALAFSTPVLVSDIRENIEAAGAHAYVFQTGNVADLARQLELLLRRPDAIAETRRKLATVRDESGSWERLVDRYEAIYREVAGRGASGGRPGLPDSEREQARRPPEV